MLHTSAFFTRYACLEKKKKISYRTRLKIPEKLKNENLLDVTEGDVRF